MSLHNQKKADYRFVLFCFVFVFVLTRCFKRENMEGNEPNCTGWLSCLVLFMLLLFF
jgi:hypothetical protein